MIYKEVEGYFLTSTKSDGIKEVLVTSLKTEENRGIHKNREEQNYVYIDVIVGYNVIDSYNQKTKDSIGYDLRLLKVDGKYKIVSYKTS